MLPDQETCRTCGSKLIQRETQKKPSQLKKAYYYTAYYFCPKCKKIYHNDKFKVINEANTSSLFGDTGPVGEVDVEIWTDGACVHNGSPRAKAAWAFVSDKTEKAGRVPGVKQTNNVAEGLAIFEALDWAAKSNFKKIKLYTDSQISLHNMKKPVHLIKQNREIFQKIAGVIEKNNLTVHFEKVLGHSGDVNNERADNLANELAGKE